MHAITLTTAAFALSAAPPTGWTIVDVSAYCPCALCCGPDAKGITAAGWKARGKIIAAPATWPIGTVIDVPGWGRGLVGDRGGAIKEAGAHVGAVRVDGQTARPVTLVHDRLDVLMPTHAAAKRWGRRTLAVYVWPAAKPAPIRPVAIVTNRYNVRLAPVTNANTTTTYRVRVSHDARTWNTTRTTNTVNNRTTYNLTAR